jgi:hypothetical protein
MKTCAKCSTEKPLSAFHKSARSKDGCASYCKTCALSVVNDWRKTNPAKRAENQRNYARRYSEKLREAKERRKARDPQRHREIMAKAAKRSRLKSYGMTEKSFFEAVERQNNSCAICQHKFGDRRKPVIDHCHSTGRTRDILCSPCNTSLGHIEKPGFVAAALAYLERHRATGNLQKAG